MPALVTVDRKLALHRCGAVNLSVYGMQTWSDSSWDEYLSFTHKLESADDHSECSIVYCSFAIPNAAQRRRAVDTAQDAKTLQKSRRVVLLTHSGLARAAANTFAAFARLRSGGTIDTRAFRPGDVHDAFDWLGETSVFDRQAVLMALVDMVTTVGYSEPEIRALASARVRERV